MEGFYRAQLRVRLALTGALMGIVMLVSYPIEAAEAARRSMEIWATAFAPALFPFFVLLPALSTPEAVAIYERLFGAVTQRAFGVGGAAGGAVFMGWMAGSPAGAIALSRVKHGMGRGEVTRAALLSSSLSPGFLVSAVGAGVLASPEAGHLLMRSQWLALAVAGVILRGAWRDDDAPCGEGARSTDGRPHPIGGAVLDLLTVCGWMVAFGVLARMVALVLPGAGVLLLPVLEIAGGASALACAIAPLPARLIALSFFCGCGGLAVLLQNAQRLPEVPRRRLALGKLLHGALAAVFTALQLTLPMPAIAWPMDTFETALVMGSLFCIAVAAMHHIGRRNRAER